MNGPDAMMDPKRAKNVRTALILLTIAVAFFAGIIIKQALLGG